MASSKGRYLAAFAFASSRQTILGETLTSFQTFVASVTSTGRKSVNSLSRIGVQPFSAMSSSSEQPKRPFAYFKQAPCLDLSDLTKQIDLEEENRNKAYETSRKLQIATTRARTLLETSSAPEASSSPTRTLAELFASLIPEKATREIRLANLSHRVQDHVQYQAFGHFLETAKLLPPSSCPYATDEEYLAGACMGLAQDLSRYGLGRAIERDLSSIELARNLVQEILEYLLQFDFRNGPLRRKYDGTKYQLQSLETLLYELSVTTNDQTQQEHLAKKAKIEDDSSSSSLIPTQELEELRLRVHAYDEMREVLIKNCRDGQKAAKQSIFALHRGNTKQAIKLLHDCEENIADKLLPTIVKEPALRSGSFSNVVEEYVEAKLFYTWLHGKDNNDESKSPSGILMAPQDFTLMELEPPEYLGGLCDLSGEVGRFAVQRGTVRDVEGIQLCLETNASILYALQTLPRLPGGIGKKMDQVRRSVEKLERMLYLQTLSEATGGRHVEMPPGENVEASKEE